MFTPNGTSALTHFITCSGTYPLRVDGIIGDVTDVSGCTHRFAQYSTPPSTQTASYTLTLADGDLFTLMNCGSACSLTVPLNSSVAFPIGKQICFEEAGSGAVTLVGISGVTLNAYNTTILNGQNAVGCIYQSATNGWTVVGNFQ